MNSTTLQASAANENSDSWLMQRKRLIGIAAALLALLLAVWLIFAPSKITPFTIAAGQGINAHVDYPTSIDLAEKNNLPIYRGQGWNEANRITPDEARSLEGELNLSAVTVRVNVGDHFDADGNYTPAAFVGANNDWRSTEARNYVASRQPSN